MTVTLVDFITKKIIYEIFITRTKDMRILVVEDGQHALTFCRYLARLGHKIIFATTYKPGSFHSKLLSKYYYKTVRLESSESYKERIKEIKKIYNKHKCDVFFPFGFWRVTDYINAANEDESLRMNTPYGDYESYWKLSDKFLLYETLKGSGVKLPKLYSKVKQDDKIKLKKNEFPAIVKGSFGVGVKNNVILAWSNKEIRDFLKNWKGTGDEQGEFIVQQYIPGFICDVGGYSIDGELFYGVPQKRIIMVPLRGGPAAVNVVFDEPKLIELAKSVVKRGKWTGPFDLEFRYDPRTDDYYVLEFNAKMWGSSPLSLKSNPDLVDIAVKTAVGRKVKKSLGYKKGLRYRWATHQELKAIGMGGFVDVMGYFGRFLKRSYYDIDLKDPKPDLIRFVETLIEVLFHRDRLPEPLIERDINNRLNRIK